MLRVVTAEELTTRTKNDDRLTNGAPFDLGGKRFFLTVGKRGDMVDVIAVAADKRGRLLRGEPCTRSMWHFDDWCVSMYTIVNDAACDRNKTRISFRALRSLREATML